MQMITVTISKELFDAATVACSYAKDAVRDIPELADKYAKAYDAMIQAQVNVAVEHFNKGSK